MGTSDWRLFLTVYRLVAVYISLPLAYYSKARMQIYPNVEFSMAPSVFKSLSINRCWAHRSGVRFLVSLSLVPQTSERHLAGNSTRSLGHYRGLFALFGNSVSSEMNSSMLKHSRFLRSAKYSSTTKKREPFEWKTDSPIASIYKSKRDSIRGFSRVHVSSMTSFLGCTDILERCIPSTLVAHYLYFNNGQRRRIGDCGCLRMGNSLLLRSSIVSREIVSVHGR